MREVNTYDSYLAGFVKEQDPFIKEIEDYAVEHYVPIMDRRAIDVLLGLLRIQKPGRILEVGSAIGYSAIRMATTLPNATILTIERDTERYMKAIEFIERSGFTERIRIIEADALELETDEIVNESFDALFIDAAKGQYKRFFEKYAPALTAGGVIYCDNMFMHGMVLREDVDVPKRNRTMIRKLKEFTQWAMSHPDYEAVLLPFGDGILIATKK
ncbi:O-methyltransferase [Sporosarcina sp. G11-34]|nr:O-methyltransferase [Sporosarcina sp. G11-34]